MGKLRITYTKSGAGQRHIHRRTIRALGLRKLQQTIEVEDNLTMRGMLESVKHMVKVERVQA